MPRFQRAVKQFFRISKKSGETLPRLPQDSEVLAATTPIPVAPQTTGETYVEDSPVTQNRPESPCTTGELTPAAQSSTDTITEAVDDGRDYVEDQGKDEEGEDRDGANSEEKEHASKTLPSDLNDEPCLQMMMDQFYVALSDSDRKIAALRTRDGQRFTHIVRLDFTRPPNDENIRLSHWSTQEIRHPNNGLHELRITFPNLAFRLSNVINTALTPKQLSTARDFIAAALPHRNPDWETSRLGLPSPVKRGRVIVVGPLHRQADVLAIFLCYRTFLTGVDGQTLLGNIRKEALVCLPWRNQSLGEHTLERVERAARNYKQEQVSIWNW